MDLSDEHRSRPFRIGMSTQDPDRDNGGPDRDEGVLLEERVVTKRPSLYRVLLHNDDYTTMEFVVAILMDVFHKTRDMAMQVMLTVHTKGVGVAGVYTRDVAETKVAQVMERAREAGMPLMCTTEPDD